MDQEYLFTDPVYRLPNKLFPNSKSQIQTNRFYGSQKHYGIYKKNYEKILNNK